MSKALLQIDSILNIIDKSNSIKKDLIIGIGSTNPTKINAVKLALYKLFPNNNIIIHSIKAQSNVSNQPKSKNESIKGAFNRAINTWKILLNKIPNIKLDYCIGIEGGIEIVKLNNNNNRNNISNINNSNNININSNSNTNNVYFQSGWIVVINKYNNISINNSNHLRFNIGIGTSARIELNNKIAERLLYNNDNDSVELGSIMDELSGIKNVGKKQGYFGIVTNGILDRTNAYMHGVLFAFGKFVSNKKYWS